MIIIILLTIWIVCGIITYSIAFAWFQGELPTLSERYYREDMGCAILVGILGPVALILVFLVSGLAEHGFKWK